MLTMIGKKFVPGIVAVLLLLATWTSTLDAPAMEQIDAGMKRALVTFTAARALNAAISLLQGTEVTVGLFAEVTMSIGQILDPVNDLVESFSNLMLIASVAFGIQKVLLMVGQYEYVKYALTLLILAWGTAQLLTGKRPRWLDVILLLVLMVRFAVPVVTIGSDAFYTRFLEPEYAKGQAALSTTTDDFKQDADPGALTSMDPRPLIERLKQVAATTTDHIISLIVVFLLQTVLVPLLLVWGFYAGLRSVLSGTVS